MNVQELGVGSDHVRFDREGFANKIILAGLAAMLVTSFAVPFVPSNAWGDQGKNQSTDFISYSKAAKQGDADAQFQLGEMYRDGRGVPRDYAAAIAWYRKAAQQGNVDGQFGLGSMYKWGFGVPKDDHEGVAWYRKAAEQGHAKAQSSLGWAYQQGHGVTKDDKEAFAWYRKAAEQGDAGAQNNLGWMYREGVGGVSRNDKEAVAWYQKAAQQGYALAQSNLGAMYQQGLGVAQDDKKAVALVRKAVAQGNAEGQYSLGLMYQRGLGVPMDTKEAIDWYHKAAEQGFAPAQDALRKLKGTSDISPGASSAAGDLATAFEVRGDSRWIATPPAALTAYSQKVREKTGQSVEYVAGFTRTAGQPLEEPPLILVTTSKGRISQESLAKANKTITSNDVQGQMAQKIRERGIKMPPFRAGEIRLDEYRHIAWLETVATPSPGFKVHNITAMMLTQLGTINFALYVTPAERAARLLEFTEFLNHVVLKPEVKYQHSTQETLEVAFGSRRSNTLGYATLVLLVSLFAAACKLLARVWSRARAWIQLRGK